jgi:hypothetical protein
MLCLFLQKIFICPQPKKVIGCGGVRRGAAPLIGDEDREDGWSSPHGREAVPVVGCTHGDQGNSYEEGKGNVARVEENGGAQHCLIRRWNRLTHGVEEKLLCDCVVPGMGG